jgi:hypothetical protein
MSSIGCVEQGGPELSMAYWVSGSQLINGQISNSRCTPCQTKLNEAANEGSFLSHAARWALTLLEGSGSERQECVKLYRIPTCPGEA